VPPLRGTTPITVVPSRKTTAPVGDPEPGAVTDTAAVRVSGRPGDGDGSSLDRTTLVADLPTTCCTADDVLPPSSAVATKEAVSALAPTGRAVVVRVATPPTRAALPRGPPPSEKVTTPVGAAVAGASAATVATSATLWPDTDVAGAARLVVVLPRVTVCSRAADALVVNPAVSGR
jgi:hypothetical protein